LKYLKVIAFTHKQIELKELGKLVLCQENITEKLHEVKGHFGIDEIFYLSTCNRVEFVLSTQHKVDREFAEAFLTEMQMGLCSHSTQTFLDAASIYEGQEALNHLLRTSCSLESLIVGEKEILAQLRKAYDDCREAGLTADKLRLVMELCCKNS
jgi:glutamyl-tRNA reductase